MGVNSRVGQPNRTHPTYPPKIGAKVPTLFLVKDLSHLFMSAGTCRYSHSPQYFSGIRHDLYSVSFHPRSISSAHG